MSFVTFTTTNRKPSKNHVFLFNALRGRDCTYSLFTLGLYEESARKTRLERRPVPMGTYDPFVCNGVYDDSIVLDQHTRRNVEDRKTQ